MTPRRELDLLINASKPDSTEALELDPAGFDQAVFLDAAYRHRVAAMVGTRLSAAGVFTPDSRLEYVADALLAAYLLNERKNGILLATAAELAAALSSSGIPYAVRKGCYLTPAVYRDPGLRPMSDIDIFVDRAASQDLSALLRDSGFQQGAVTSDGTIVPPTRREEVFWSVHVNNLPTFQRRSTDPVVGTISVDVCIDLFLPASGCRLPATDLLAGLRTFDLAGTVATTFAAPHFLLDVAAHLYKESTTLRYIERGKHQRLLQYVDIAAILSHETDFDWNSLLAVAVEAGAAGNVYFALANTDELFPGTVPGTVLEQLAEAGDVSESFLREYGAVDLGKPMTWSSSSIVERLYSDERAAVTSKSPI